MIEVLQFSGGRCSTATLLYLLEKKRVPDAVIFCNTGMETPETLEFIRQVDDRIIKPAGLLFVMLEFCLINGKRRFKAVTHDELCTDGKVFFNFVKATKMLPTTFTRKCTAELKIFPSARWVRDTFKVRNNFVSQMGITFDENKRALRILSRNDQKNNRLGQNNVSLPLHAAGIDRKQAMTILANSSLTLPPIETRLSNCDGCFFQPLHQRVDVARRKPELAEKWAAMERWVNESKRVAGTPRRVRTHNEKETYMKLFNRPLSKKEFIFGPDISWSDIIRLVDDPGTLFAFDSKNNACSSGYCFDG